MPISRDPQDKATVLVTGVSGFLGSHVALTALKAGFSVVGSVRRPNAAEHVTRALAEAGGDVQHLSFTTLDLLSDEGWAEAAARCDHLIHVASPFVALMPDDPDDLIRPAVEGTRRAINAALAAGHERIVLTSSMAAVHHGHDDEDRVYGPSDWTRRDGPLVSAYAASKTLAEREAWRLVEQAGQRDRLAVINPAAMLGPLLDDDPGTSVATLIPMLTGRMPMVPEITLEYVDVRDVAEAHVAALTSSEAGGQRHILAGSSLSLWEIAGIVRKALPEYAGKLPRRQMPGWFAFILKHFNKPLRDAAPFLGIRRCSDSSSGTALIGHPLRPLRDTIVETVQSLRARRQIPLVNADDAASRKGLQKTRHG
ncbi:MAG TPA: NAD-dependent epimerase/dehydratase family protein [Candidatus Defluviicoccus seviourii]|nr:NAD-dependent epimerase/dehydratase family protein [Candidatus Defluviicoccus seviourii]